MGGTFDIVSPTLKNVRGTCPPVSPPNDAHVLVPSRSRDLLVHQGVARCPTLPTQPETETETGELLQVNPSFCACDFQDQDYTSRGVPKGGCGGVTPPIHQFCRQNLLLSANSREGGNEKGEERKEGKEKEKRKGKERKEKEKREKEKKKLEKKERKRKENMREDRKKGYVTGKLK